MIMKKSSILMIFLLITLVGCSSQQQTQDVLTKTEDQGAAMQETAIAINNFKFDPETVTIKPGTKVIWKNLESASHTIKFDDWESQELFKGDSVDHVFSKKGTYGYQCGIHGSMKGSVIVA